MVSEAPERRRVRHRWILRPHAGQSCPRQPYGAELGSSRAKTPTSRGRLRLVDRSASPRRAADGPNSRRSNRRGRAARGHAGVAVVEGDIHGRPQQIVDVVGGTRRRRRL